jgi:hypothetical protein
MAQLMKAAAVDAFGEPLRVQEVQVPTPGSGQIFVNIKAPGVCYTDLHAADGDRPLSRRCHSSPVTKASVLSQQSARRLPIRTRSFKRRSGELMAYP